MQLTGDYYLCNPVKGDLVGAPGGSWLAIGLVAPGDHLRGLLGSEFDQVKLHEPEPRPLEVLFHSPVTCRGQSTYWDATYYNAPSGAGVFDAGTSSWVCALDGSHGHCGDAADVAAVGGVTTRLLQAFAAGPAGLAHPARDNLARLPGVPGLTAANAAPPAMPSLPPEPALPDPR